jgi:hypothetical protein
MSLTSRRSPLSTTAYTLPTRRVPTNTVPLLPTVSERALGSPSAHTLIWNPGGSLIFSSGRSFAGFAVSVGA